MQLAAKQPSRQEIVLRRVIIEPIWEMGMDGSAKLVSRRNVHTDEVEIVEGWGASSSDNDDSRNLTQVIQFDASRITTGRRPRRTMRRRPKPTP
jgi:hypothetical protein